MEDQWKILADCEQSINKNLSEFSEARHADASAISRLIVCGSLLEKDLDDLVREGLDQFSIDCWRKYYKPIMDRFLKLKAFW